jgi:hypothetical protein
MPTNGEAMRSGKVPCEWNPYRDRPARLSEGFHAEAELSGGKVSKDSAKQDRKLRVCRDCAARPAVEEAARTPGKAVSFRELWLKGGDR